MIYNQYLEIFIIFFYIFKNLIFFIFNRDKFILIKNITVSISKINIIYMKIFQSISINSSFFDKKTQDYLIQYTDKVPFKENDIDFEAINTLKPFIEFDTKPINSGIFALVYKGKYNNKNVAIKILKKDIRIKLNNCIDNLEILFYIFSFISYLKNINLYIFLMQNKKNLINQTFLENESYNLKNFKESLQNNNNIIIPEIHDNFTKSNIIVMDFIEGKNFTQLKKEEYNKYGKLLLNINFNKNGINNYIHSDLHVGNILFLENKICILDFGMIIKIKDTYKILFFDLLYSCIIENDYYFIYNNFNLFMSKRIDFNKISNTNKIKLKNLIYESTKYVFENEIDLFKLINEINDIIKEYNVFIDVNIIEIAFSYTFLFNTLNKLLDNSFMNIYKDEFKNIFNIFDLDL